jgi:hypothetical protein
LRRDGVRQDAITGPEATSATFTNVLVGIDGRQGGRNAIALARQLAAAEATFTLGQLPQGLPGELAPTEKVRRAVVYSKFKTSSTPSLMSW